MKYYLKFSSLFHIIFLFVLWQLCSLWVNDEFLLPSPGSAMFALKEKINEGHFWHALISSFKNLLLAFLLGMTILICICLLSTNKHLKEFFKTIISVFVSLPSFAILPVLLIIFGISYKTMLALLIYSMLWINLSYAIAALEQVSNRWQPHVKNLKISKLVELFYVVFPAMMPAFIICAKNSWTLCWRTLLAVEVIFGNLASGFGIGVMMTMDRVNFRVADIWGMIIFIAFISYVISWAFDKLLTKIKWHTNGR